MPWSAPMCSSAAGWSGLESIFGPRDWHGPGAVGSPPERLLSVWARPSLFLSFLLFGGRGGGGRGTPKGTLPHVFEGVFFVGGGSPFYAFWGRLI